MNLIEQIASHIEFVGLGALNTDEQEGNVFWGNMPDAPDECVCVYSTDSAYAGSEDGARVQIIVRAKTTKKTYEWSQAIAEEFAEFNGFLCGDGAMVDIAAINTSCGLGADTKRREMYSSNFRVKYCNYV